jgi:hypothetical protein
LHRLTTHLADLYTNVVVPPAIFECARDVVEDAYRNAFRTAGVRMQHLAETRTDTTELGVELVAICTRLVDLRHRARHASPPGRPGCPGSPAAQHAGSRAPGRRRPPAVVDFANPTALNGCRTRPRL